MDLVGALLDGHRGRDPFVLTCAMSEPWGVRIADRAAVALVVVEMGQVCLVPAGAAPVHLGAGDTVIVQRTDPYGLADAPGRAADVVVEPGQVCRPLTARGAAWPPPGPGAWGNDPEGPTRFLVAVYELPGQVCGRVLADLPPIMATAGSGRERDVVGTLVGMLADEAAGGGPGHRIVMARLVDLVLIDTLRRWLAAAGPAAPGWYRAEGDRVSGTALALIHDRPEEPWTLSTLAAHAGVSRATLARRFATDVGTPPLAYLTEWRLARAADLLSTTVDTVERVARQVGYTNPFAFSTAFKRRYGHSPREHRAADPA